MMNDPKSQRLSTLRRFVLGAGLGVALCIGSTACAAEEPLPSWNDGPAKKAILEFVAAVTDKDGKDYVEPSERIAVFDHVGTLDKALDQADANDWIIVNMKNDWNQIFPHTE
jgi:hypothetical protein